MTDHLQQLIDFAASSAQTPRVVGPYVRVHIDRSGERDVHFAAVWLVDWLHANRRLGYRGPHALEPRAPLTHVLGAIISGSPELAARFVATDTALDYAPGLSAEQQREAESRVPEDWLSDADV